MERLVRELREVFGLDLKDNRTDTAQRERERQQNTTVATENNREPSSLVAPRHNKRQSIRTKSSAGNTCSYKGQDRGQLI